MIFREDRIGDSGSYPTTPSYLGGIFRRKKKENSKKTLYLRILGLPPLPGVGIYNPGVKGRRPTTPLPRGPSALAPFSSSLSAPPPRRVLVSDPGVGAGGGVVQPRPREAASLVIIKKNIRLVAVLFSEAHEPSLPVKTGGSS